VRLTTRDDDAARRRAHAASGDRRPHRSSSGYLAAEPGRLPDLEPRTCRCTAPAPVADVDRLTTTVTVTCLTCGKHRAVLDRLDLAALAAARRAAR
jgi:hypothetical protein